MLTRTLVNEVSSDPRGTPDSPARSETLRRRVSREEPQLMRFSSLNTLTDLLIYAAGKIKPFLQHFLHGKETRCLSDAVQGLFGWGLKDAGSVVHTCVVFGKC